MKMKNEYKKSIYTKLTLAYTLFSFSFSSAVKFALSQPLKFPSTKNLSFASSINQGGDS